VALAAVERVEALEAELDPLRTRKRTRSAVAA
jgi:hypothetical protein